MTNQQITGIVLAGGKSSRMQTDKGLVSYKGKLLIEHALDQIKPFCNEILISANKNEYERFGYPVIKDSVYNLGPLGGIYSSIQRSSNTICLIIACDILGIDSELIESMIQKAQTKSMVYLKDKDNFMYPLPIILHKYILSSVELQIGKGDFKLQNLIHKYKQGNSSKVECLKIRNPFKNLNSPEDLKL